MDRANAHKTFFCLFLLTLFLVCCNVSGPAAMAKAGSTVIVLTDEQITIDGPGAQAEGSTLTITSDGVYELTGSLSSGQVVIDASREAAVELVLAGVDITAGENAAIYCKEADELIITLAEGTHNTLRDAPRFSFADGEKEEPDATLFSKCDLSIGGSGQLTVNAGFRHGINTKDDLVVMNGTISVSAAMDAIRGTDSVTVKEGSFDLAAGRDAIRSSKAGDSAKGWIVLEGGTCVIRCGGDAIQAENSLHVSGGIYDIHTEGTPAGTSSSQKGMKAGSILTVDGGTFNIISCDDAIHADADVFVNGGTFSIETMDDGIHANRNLYINGGVIEIPVCYEGFEGTIIEVNGGKSFIDASNDAISAAAGTPEADSFSGRGGNPSVQAWFNGGELEAVAGGDVVDSNGNIYVTGGTLWLSAPPWPDYEGSLLCNGDVTITGGTIASVGCMGVNVYWDQQPILWVSHKNELPKGTVLSLRDEAGKSIVELTTREEAVQSVFTSPDLLAGSTYALYIDDVRKIEVTLSNGMNVTGDDGGAFTGGYSRGNMAEYR